MFENSRDYLDVFSDAKASDGEDLGVRRVCILNLVVCIAVFFGCG